MRTDVKYLRPAHDTDRRGGRLVEQERDKSEYC
jgi:hypothetical protein